jgi:phytoene synthase
MGPHGETGGSTGMTSDSTPRADGGGVCRTVTKQSRSNFAYAFYFLPRAKREALYAIYAFCRLTDDLVDEAASRPAERGDPRAAALRDWRKELDACCRGVASHPVARRLGEILQQFPIPRHYFEELLNGVEMDLGGRRYESFAELEQYCYRVAGVVGLMCIEVFGYTQPATRLYAERLGTAFQLTNVLRDLGADAAGGRVYLPQEDLRRFGVSEDDLSAGRLTPAVRELLRFEVERTRQLYAAARAALPTEDRRAMLPAQVMCAIYARLLEEIERRAYDVFSSRVALSDGRRLCLALAAWAENRLGLA